MTLDLDAIRELEVIAPDEHSVTRFVPFVQMDATTRDALVGRIQELTQERDALVVSAATVVPAHMTLTSDEQTAAKRIDQLNAMVACESDWVEHWEARAVKAEARLVLAEKARRAEQVRANKAEAERDTLRANVAAMAVAEDYVDVEDVQAALRAALTRGAGDE